jgi:hypothetical protein
MRDGAVPRAAVETLSVDPLGFYETELIRAAMLLAPRRRNRGGDPLRRLMSVGAYSTMAGLVPAPQKRSRSRQAGSTETPVDSGWSRPSGAAPGM